jgi:hypothetical protein
VPGVHIETPVVDEHTGLLTVRWSTDNPGGADLMAKVDVSSDDGAIWRPVRVGPNGDSVQLPLRSLLTTDRARVRVRVNDGFNETSAVSERFGSPGVPPTVRILSPADGQRIAPNASLYLEGEAVGDAGGRLGPLGTNAASSLTWFVDDVLVGNGSATNVLGLPVGVRRVRLDARDARGTTSSTEVGIIVGSRSQRPPGNPLADLVLLPQRATNQRDHTHTVTAGVWVDGVPQTDVSVTFAITSGPNSGLGEVVQTDGSGRAVFSYVGSGGIGTDTIRATADPGTRTSGLGTVSDEVAVVWGEGAP